VLLLWHDLGAAGEVRQGWRPLLARRRPGAGWRRTCPVTAARGRCRAYTFESLATAVAGITHGARGGVLGHSPGGVTGLALAGAGFTMSVRAVTGPRIKTARTGQEPDRAAAAARRPPAWLASRDEAAARYLRTSGPAGQPAAAGPAVDAGPQEHRGRRLLAMDPGAFAGGRPARRDCQPGARPR
jgi:hypothetical protein